MSRDPVVRLDSIGAEVRIDVRLDVGEHSAAPSAPPASSAMASPLAPAGRPLDAGRIVGGRYELVRLLGQGSMGAVWLASHTTLGEHVALKLMAPTAESGAAEDASTSAARFRFEAQIAARLSRKTHHVVRVTDHGQDGLLPYLVMELLHGETLEQALLCRGPMSVGEVSGLVGQIARGLAAAHSEGVLHRDLKPANVFLAKNGDGTLLVKLLDFGVAWGHGSQRFGAPYATARGLIVGTPGYMSPEQASASEIDVRSDLWSLAAMAYEALTCALPVDGSDAEHVLANLRACRTVPIRHHRSDLPGTLDRFFERAFAPRIEDRYSTCAELAHEFAEAVRRVETPSRARSRPYARYVAVAFLIGVGLLGTRYATSGGWRNQAASSGTSGLATASSLAQAAAPGPTRAVGPPPQTTTSGAASALWTQAAEPSPPAAPRRAVRRPPAGDLGEFKSYY